MKNSPLECASELIEVVPLMMRVIRARVRSQTGPELTVPQFRALAFLGRNDGVMLGDVANFLALTLPSTSKMIDGLVVAGLARREMDPNDRRKVSLGLTPEGEARYAQAFHESEHFLAERVSGWSPADRAQLVATMRRLHEVFADEPPETREGAPKPRPPRPANARLEPAHA